jgi:hypothetical protein
MQHDRVVGMRKLKRYRAADAAPGPGDQRRALNRMLRHGAATYVIRRARKAAERQWIDSYRKYSPGE